MKCFLVIFLVPFLCLLDTSASPIVKRSDVAEEFNTTRLIGAVKELTVSEDPSK